MVFGRASSCSFIWDPGWDPSGRRGFTPTQFEIGQCLPRSALAALEATRKVLLDGVGHVKEEDFYRLQTIGHDEYSVLSILENDAAHDREHAEQIRKTLATS